VETDAAPQGWGGRTESPAVLAGAAQTLSATTLGAAGIAWFDSHPQTDEAATTLAHQRNALAALHAEAVATLVVAGGVGYLQQYCLSTLWVGSNQQQADLYPRPVKLTT